MKNKILLLSALMLSVSGLASCGGGGGGSPAASSDVSISDTSAVETSAETSAAETSSSKETSSKETSSKETSSKEESTSAEDTSSEIETSSAEDTSSEEETSSSDTSVGPNLFQVTFKNYDEKVLYVADVYEGETAIYAGEEPTKPSTVNYDYAFKGWDRDLTNVHESFVTYAVFEEVLRKYTITFVNYDDTVLQQTEVGYGLTPTYDGATPTQPSDGKAEYTFTGWTPTITPVTGNQTYKATYDASYVPTYRTTGLVFEAVGYNEAYAVIAYFGSETTVAIPQYFDGLPVTAIKAGAFSNHDKLENVFIPKTVTRIEKHVFDNCPAISYITVGDGNPTYFIDDNGDLATTNTLVYTLPTHRGSYEVKDEYTQVLEGAFSASGIATLSISADSFTTLPALFAVDGAHMPTEFRSVIVKGGNIGNEQFMDCSHIQSLAMLNTGDYNPVYKVGDRAFKNCTSLQRLVFSDDLTWIGKEAFMNCESLTKLTLGSSSNINLTHIGKNAFTNLPNVEKYREGYSDTGVLYLGNPNCHSLIAMGPSYKSDLRYLNVDEATVAIVEEAFWGCPKLKTITLYGDKLSYIGERAFGNCASLDTFHFDIDEGHMKNISYIPNNVFSGCSALNSVNNLIDADSERPFYIMKLNSDNNYITQYVKGISINALNSRGSKFAVSVSINNTTYTLNGNVVYDMMGNVVCGNYVADEEYVAYCGGQYIYPYAFYGVSLKSVIFDEGLESIGVRAFSAGTIATTEIKFPHSLKSIGSYAFYNLVGSPSASSKLYFFARENLTTIGNRAFYGTRSVDLYTPLAEKPEGWASDYDEIDYYSYFHTYFNYVYSD